MEYVLCTVLGFFVGGFVVIRSNTKAISDISAIARKVLDNQDKALEIMNDGLEGCLIAIKLNKQLADQLAKPLKLNNLNKDLIQG